MPDHSVQTSINPELPPRTENAQIDADSVERGTPEAGGGVKRLHNGKNYRMTEQRRAVYESLMGRRDHPTAVEVFLRVKEELPTISLATVYNCLERLNECGFVRMVSHDREPTRYCPNLSEHAHLFCAGCGAVVDIPLRSVSELQELFEVPNGILIQSQDVSFQGLCSECTTKKRDAQEHRRNNIISIGKENHFEEDELSHS